jgi:hypothetical protein
MFRTAGWEEEGEILFPPPTPGEPLFHTAGYEEEGETLPPMPHVLPPPDYGAPPSAVREQGATDAAAWLEREREEEREREGERSERAFEELQLRELHQELELLNRGTREAHQPAMPAVGPLVRQTGQVRDSGGGSPLGVVRAPDG